MSEVLSLNYGLMTFMMPYIENYRTSKMRYMRQYIIEKKC
jgi:hypothetical protein